MNSDRVARVSLLGLMLVLAPWAASSTAAPKGTGSEPVIDGEKFVKRELIDQQQGGMSAGWVFAPQKWKVDSRITWHYDWFDNPVTISCSVENPANAEAFYCFPQVVLEWIEVPAQLQRYQKNPAQPGSPTPTA